MIAQQTLDASQQPAVTGTSPAVPTGARRKVCHISLGLCTGGMERLLVEFARCCDRDLYELHFVALHNLGQPAEDIKQLGGNVHLLPDLRGKPYAQWCELVRFLRELKPDVVHTHNAYPHFYGTLAARWCRIPVVINTRHGRRIGTTWKARTWFWIAGMLADRVVAVSEDARKLCLEEVSLPARKVARVWNGIDLSRFTFRGPATDPVAISVARLSPEKDFPTLIRAVALAAEVVPELRLKIVGDGPERGKIEQLIGELGQASRIELLGERQDIPELLATAGFFATATLTEGISLTLLEAMASGLPVLATSVGGNPEIVEEDRTGYLVPSGNPEILAAALVRMVHASGLWPELGRQGRQRVEQHFSNRKMVREYETLYANLCGTKGRGSSPQTPSPDPDQRTGKVYETIQAPKGNPGGTFRLDVPRSQVCETLGRLILLACQVPSLWGIGNKIVDGVAWRHESKLKSALHRTTEFVRTIFHEYRDKRRNASPLIEHRKFSSGMYR